MKASGVTLRRVCAVLGVSVLPLAGGTRPVDAQNQGDVWMQKGLGGYLLAMAIDRRPTSRDCIGRIGPAGSAASGQSKPQAALRIAALFLNATATDISRT